MNKPIGIALLSVMMIGRISAAPGTLSIKNLPSAAIEDFPVCYDDTSGQLGNCPANFDKIEIAVNCSISSLQDAIDSAPAAGWVQFNVAGTCNESVRILRSQTIIQGSPGAKIVGQNADGAGVEVYGGTNNIYIRDMSISDGLGEGLRALHGSSVSLEDSIIQNNTGGEGVMAGYGAVIKLYGGNTVTASGTNTAVLAFDGSSIVIQGSTNTLVNSASLQSGFPTVNTLRNSVIRLRDSQIVTNTNDGLAFGAYHNSSIRQDFGFMTVTGTLDIYNLSSIEFRDASILGNANVGLLSTVRFRDEDKGIAGDDGNNATLTGTVNANSFGVADFKSSFTMNGNVQCSGGFASGSPTFASGSFVGC